jgi:hypothetical protein
VKLTIQRELHSCDKGIDLSDRRMQLAAVAVLALAAAATTQRAEAAMGDPSGDPGHLGVVLEAAGEFGGDDLFQVYYRHGGSQTIKAGQGVTVDGGIHFRPVSLPIDFAATVGYKFVRTAAYDTDLGVDRVVFKFTGTAPLGNHFWVTAGPVWHTGIKLNGDGFIPDVRFEDAVGGLAGIGWRWLGLTYTYIKYRAPEGDFDASNVGIGFTWKF